MSADTTYTVTLLYTGNSENPSRIATSDLTIEAAKEEETTGGSEETTDGAGEATEPGTNETTGDSPDTGDLSSVARWLWMSLAALVLMVGVAVSFRFERKKK